MKTINFIFLQLFLQDEIQIKKKKKKISSTKKGMIRKNTTCTGTMTNASCVSNRSSLLPCVENKKNKLKGRRCHSRDRKENTRREVTSSHHLATRSHWTHGHAVTWSHGCIGLRRRLWSPIPVGRPQTRVTVATHSYLNPFGTSHFKTQV